MDIKSHPSFVQRCVCDTVEGLCAGLSHFSGKSSVAVIYQLLEQDEMYIYDPYSLLRGHEPKLKKYYLHERVNSHDKSLHSNRFKFRNITFFNDLQLDGLISYGGKSDTVPYQLWFTEHHPDLSSTGPTQRWLEHAVLRFSHDIANEEDLYTGISGDFLREFSTHAISNHLIQQRHLLASHTSTIEFYPVLNAILAISRTREEGKWPKGELVFVEPSCMSNIEFIARFKASEQPQLGHYKHVRKLLQAVEFSSHKLISDGMQIVGISTEKKISNALTADFQGRVGFLRINEENICSLADGRFQSTTHRAKLFEIEEALLDHDLSSMTRDTLFQTVSSLVHNAEDKNFGCSMVIDLNTIPLQLAGQTLEEPLDLSSKKMLELSCSLSQVDGALHIGSDNHLHGFACLLDGHVISGEDRARGARYNSALRFSFKNPKTILVVVSNDHLISVVQHGIEIHGINQWRSQTPISLKPELLQNWLAVGE